MTILNRLKSAIWAPYKAKLQEKQIQKELEYYQQRAVELTIDIKEITQPEYVKRKLLDRLKSRNIQKKQKGDLHILYITPYDYWERINIPPALEKFGKLSTFYMQDYGFNVLEHDYLKDWLEKRHTFDKKILEFVSTLHTKEPIDIIVSYVSGWHIAPETIHKINSLGILTTAFWLDDKLKFRGRIAEGRYEGAASVASAYDLNLTSASSSIVKYFVEGGLALFWPEAANPDIFKPLNVPFKYDVSFIGAKYGKRPEYIKYLRENEIDVHAFGFGWNEGGIKSEEMINIYSQSKINLGFGGIGYSMNATCLKGRDFEVPMCGAVYLTSHDEDLPKVYDIGKEIFTYTSKEDMLQKVKFLLSQPELCKKVRVASREKCLKEHTWEKRFEEVFRFAEIMN